MISRGAKLVIDILNDAGYEAFVVGGCIRDTIIGIPINDWDIATSAVPEEVKTVFSEYKVIETGIQHGTVTLLMEGIAYEVTTFRFDSDYHDHRHPVEVKYSISLKDDLERRDFTMNAIAYHPEEGIVDLFGGVTDIENKIIKCVGDASKRFEEDSLRILRAIRFSSKLDFEIEDNTKQAMFNKKGLLSFLSKERITKELLDTLNGQGVSRALVEYRDIWKEAIDKIYDIITEEVCFDDLAQDEILRLSRLVLPLSSDDLLVFLRSLRLSKQEEKRVKLIHGHQMIVFNDNVKQLKHLMSRVSAETFEDLVELFAIDKDEVRRKYKEIVDNKECYHTSMLAVSGLDLQNLGVTPSDVGTTLDLIVREIIEENLENDRDILLAYITGIITKKGSN